MTDAVPPPLPPDDLPEDDYPPPSTASKVVPWVVFGLCLLVMLTIASCVDRCSRQVDKIWNEVKKYNTEPGTSWSDQTVVDAETFLGNLPRDERAANRQHQRRGLVMRGTLTKREQLDEDAALLTLGTQHGDVQVRMSLMSTSAKEAFAAVKEGDVIVVAGFVDWINRRTVAMRDGMLQAQWLASERR